MAIESEFSILNEVIDRLQNDFQHSFTVETDLEEVSVILNEVADRMMDNYPYFDTNYAGQMLKPPHPVSRLAYMLAMYFNPNNHALDGGRASSQMEKEAVAKIAEMFGWTVHLGHLTGGGTMANMEALWVAKKEHPDKMVVASNMAHYTHQRISDVLGIKYQSIRTDQLGRMSAQALEQVLTSNDVGTVVVTLGTTGTGSIDPLSEILELQKKYDFRIHIDSAYGGYFGLANNLNDYGAQQYSLIHQADSIVIDPHKHGLQPYGCGCILFKDPKMGAHYKHDSPYTYFSSAELHLGEISLECSRPGAAAVALWATMQLFPLEKNGKFSAGLESCIKAARKLSALIKSDNRFQLVMEPELDIVVWAPTGKSLSEISKASTSIFEKAAAADVHLALIKIPTTLLSEVWNDVKKDQEYVTCLRSCLMKFEHLDWVDEIWRVIQSSMP
ncbi:MAG: aminotransferase class V-fold PLP-dependent enzyme [Fulvivirga sp.]|uniref:pyridoxal phosphate-dependent decarboxylase family protein n=1 Tax=Fulvivirga sp. TaxID=1931237 RepID=UPI0032ECB4A8